MTQVQPSPSQASSRASRREFLKLSAAAGATALGGLAVSRTAQAAGSQTLKVGLIGCGGRGSGAAGNAMNSGKDVKLVAMGDVFEDRLTGALARLKVSHPDQVAVDKDCCFVGFDAYQKVLRSGIDVVVIATASHFHPVILKAAIDANKHVFCEKPHGLDAPGLKVAMAAGEEAKKKKLSLVSGLCWRYDAGVRETMKRVLDGAIGEIVAIQETYITGPYGLVPRKPGWTEMEYQLHNWYHFNWLSGDQTGQQLIHSIDKASWALGDRPPKKAWGTGGRQVCVEPQYGDQFDHHAVAFEYDNGVRVYGFCRDQVGCFNETSDHIFGTKGRAILPVRCRIEGQTNWRYEEPRDKPGTSMYDNEHRALFDSIRSGKPLNNSNYMFTSTMLGILAQMVCYTGQEITWEQAMESKLVLAPAQYDWNAQPPVMPEKSGQYPCAMPGITKFK